MLLQTFSTLVRAALWEKLQDFTALSSFTNKHKHTECLSVCRCGHTCFSQTESGCFCFKQTCVSLWVHVQTEVCTLEWWSSLWMCVRISELFGMAPFVSLSFLCLLLSDLELVYGGIMCFIFSIIMISFSLTGGSSQLCSLTSTVLTACQMVDRPQRLHLCDLWDHHSDLKRIYSDCIWLFVRSSSGSSLRSGVPARWGSRQRPAETQALQHWDIWGGAGGRPRERVYGGSMWPGRGEGDLWERRQYGGYSFSFALY